MSLPTGYKKKPRTHCLKNHPLTEENTEIGSDGRRRCITCRRERDVRYRQRTNKGTRLQGPVKFSFPAPLSLRNMSEAELAWVAGWLEGEGCFQVQRASNYIYPKILAASTDLDTLEHVLKITGVGRITYRKKEKSHHKDCWTWQVTRHHDAAALLRLLEPRMMSRRARKIREVLEATDGR